MPPVESWQKNVEAGASILGVFVSCLSFIIVFPSIGSRTGTQGDGRRSEAVHSEAVLSNLVTGNVLGTCC